MHQGRYQLGQEVPLWVITTDATGAPAAPDACPRADVYSASDKPVSGRALPPVDWPGVTGLFGGSVFLDEAFAAGRYTAAVRWTVGSYQGSRLVAFEVAPGGDGSGAVVSLFYYPRPQGDFLVQQRDSGRIYQGKGPRL